MSSNKLSDYDEEPPPACGHSLLSRIVTVMLAAVVARLPGSLRWRLAGLVERLSVNPFFAPNCVFVVKRSHCLWRLNPSDYMCRDVFWYGAMDRNDFRLISRNVTKGAHILDIGSNFGYYSVSLAKLLGGECRIDAFEPFPATFTKLQANVKLNSAACIRVHQIALGAREGVLPMLSVKGNTGATFISQKTGDAGGVTVPVKRLDQFIRDEMITRLEFIKIDVEGFECEVLEGGQQALAELRPVIMIEMCPENLTRQNRTVEMLMTKLRECGYRSFYVTSRDGVELFSGQSFSGGWSYRNVFCFADDQSWNLGR